MLMTTKAPLVAIMRMQCKFYLRFIFAILLFVQQWKTTINRQDTVSTTVSFWAELTYKMEHDQNYFRDPNNLYIYNRGLSCSPGPPDLLYHTILLRGFQLSSNILTSLLRPSQKHSLVFSGFWVWSSGSKSCRSKWNRWRGMQEIIVVSWWLFSQYNINGMILLKCIYNTVHKITKCQFNKFNDLEVTQHHPLEQRMHSHNCSIKYRCHLNHPKDLQWTIFA